MQNKTTKYKSRKGVSLLIVIGSYGGFHCSRSSSSLHFCFAYIAVTLFFYDVENALAQIFKKEEAQKHEQN